MRNKIRYLVLLFICFTSLVPLCASEVIQGYIRLVLHENTGRFTLYGLVGEEQWEPLFSSQDPRTSYLAVNIDDRIYKMGDTSSFRFRIEEDGNALNYYFESATLQVRQEFLFIKTESYQDTSGVQITFHLKNVHSQQHSVGMRFLLDTDLGEGRKKIPFYVNEKGVTDETIIAGSAERSWVSRGEQVALMGSVETQTGTNPDYLHIANWKRLNEVTWKTGLSKARNFNYPPYSIGDSAVCYYYEPKSLGPDDAVSYTIMLALEDQYGFDRTIVQTDIPTLLIQSPAQTGSASQKREVLDGATEAREADLALLYSNITRLNLYLEGNLDITEEELAAMELTINMLKARYGLP